MAILETNEIKPQRPAATAKPATPAASPVRSRPEAVLEGQNRILERIANNGSLTEVLDSLAELIESQAPEQVCSILLLEAGRLHHGAAPSLPKAYCEALDGTLIGPSVGSCGTAAFIRKPIVTSDIATDPLWKDYAHLALHYGLHACWSTPILSDNGEVLGTFALYGHTPSEPKPSHFKLVEMATHIAKIAIERHLADTALKQQAAQLFEANRRKDEFIALLAHELRNPLAPIVTALELMRIRGDDKAIVGKYRAVMERQVRHLTRLIDDLLDISRITQGKVDLRKERTTIEVLVTRAVEQSTPLIAQLHHRLHVKLPAASVELDADPVRMAQVLSNLLNNAAKYSPHGSDIFIDAEREGDVVKIRVSDTGIGMSAETLARAFDLFAQADGASGKAQGGLGIGLTLVRRIVEMHGGHVEAASAGLGKGSELVVRLPVVPRGQMRVAADSAPGSLDPLHPRDRELPAGALAGERILLVDDNVDAAESLAEAIEGAGGQVALAHDGAAALALAKRWRPRAVLLDLSLPTLDGYEVARRLRADRVLAGIRLIALTGYDESSSAQKAWQAGFDAHVVKPATLVRIAEALAAAKVARAACRRRSESGPLQTPEGEPGARPTVCQPYPWRGADQQRDADEEHQRGGAGEREAPVEGLDLERDVAFEVMEPKPV